MNYLNLYQLITTKAQYRPLPDGYVEKHHILPRSLFNDKHAQSILGVFPRLNHPDNLSILTMKEHIVCHKLLVKIFQITNPNKNCYNKMLYAATFLTNRNSRSVSWLRSQYSTFMSNELKGKPSRAKGTKRSAEFKQRINEYHHLRGRTYEEIHGEQKAADLKHQRTLQKGKIISEETKQRQRIAFASRNTEEYRLKQRNAHLGKTWSEEQKQKMKVFKSNPDTNPNVNQTKYQFIHSDGRIIVCRKWDLKYLYGCVRPHIIVRDPTARSGGWRCVTIVE